MGPSNIIEGIPVADKGETTNLPGEVEKYRSAAHGRVVKVFFSAHVQATLPTSSAQVQETIRLSSEAALPSFMGKRIKILYFWGAGEECLRFYVAPRPAIGKEFSGKSALWHHQDFLVGKCSSTVKEVQPHCEGAEASVAFNLGKNEGEKVQLHLSTSSPTPGSSVFITVLLPMPFLERNVNVGIAARLLVMEEEGEERDEQRECTSTVASVFWIATGKASSSRSFQVPLDAVQLSIEKAFCASWAIGFECRIDDTERDPNTAVDSYSWIQRLSLNLD